MKGLYGDLKAIADGPLEAEKEYPEYFVGVGAFMEGIDNNPVVYDLIFVGVCLVCEVQETAWRKEVDLKQWVRDYAESGCGCVISQTGRYGTHNKRLMAMWEMFLLTLYAQSWSDGFSSR